MVFGWRPDEQEVRRRSKKKSKEEQRVKNCEKGRRSVKKCEEEQRRTSTRLFTLIYERRPALSTRNALEELEELKRTSRNFLPAFDVCLCFRWSTRFCYDFASQCAFASVQLCERYTQEAKMHAQLRNAVPLYASAVSNRDSKRDSNRDLSMHRPCVAVRWSLLRSSPAHQAGGSNGCCVFQSAYPAHCQRTVSTLSAHTIHCTQYPMTSTCTVSNDFNWTLLNDFYCTLSPALNARDTQLYASKYTAIDYFSRHRCISNCLYRLVDISSRHKQSTYPVSITM